MRYLTFVHIFVYTLQGQDRMAQTRPNPPYFVPTKQFLKKFRSLNEEHYQVN